MPSIEEMDAEIAHVEAANRRIRDELLTKYRAELDKATDPYLQEWWRKKIAKVLAIGHGRYDD